MAIHYIEDYFQSQPNLEDIASLVGKPKAHHTAATAIARNPIAYLIPCHRVIAKSGYIHKYGHGSARKKVILGWEAGQRSAIAG